MTTRSGPTVMHHYGSKWGHFRLAHPARFGELSQAAMVKGSRGRGHRLDDVATAGSSPPSRWMERWVRRPGRKVFRATARWVILRVQPVGVAMLPTALPGSFAGDGMTMPTC